MSPETKVRTRVYSDHYGAIYRAATGFIVEYRDVQSRDTGETSISPTLAHAKAQLQDFAAMAMRVGAAKATVDSWMRAARAKIRRGQTECKFG
jgi:hypothetical protein